MDLKERKSLIEAVLFVSGEPVNLASLKGFWTCLRLTLSRV